MFYYLGIKPIYETQMVEDGEYDSYSSRGTIKYDGHVFIDLETWGIELIRVDADSQIIQSFLDNCITEEEYQKLSKPIMEGIYYIGDSPGSNGNDLYHVYMDFASGKKFEVWRHDSQPRHLGNIGTANGRLLSSYEKNARRKKPYQIP
ncbi:MAG: hypothetical protein PHX03_01000, partial [Bacilli bacterium]|nr:hypothetical protein [Bacilli bacterium]